MSRQTLLLNITRMGDVVQMGALLARLREEWPEGAIDLVIDRQFAPVAAMLPGLREVVACDFHSLIDDSRAAVKDVVSLYREVAQWARPLAERKYDRIVNLTFNGASALLAGYIGAPDIRGARSAWDGGMVIDNPWMAYFTDMHRFRRINRFNLVDIYALGGSRPGTFAPLMIEVDPQAKEWACRYLRAGGHGGISWIAVQAGASDGMKAWRPQHFGGALAHIGTRWSGGIVFVGASSERETIAQVLEAYRAAGGRNPIKNAVGATSIAQVAALLKECRLLLTNDTGPMHLAVAVGTPVVDLSVGHVDFRETGPYGPGHWVLQPDLECAPCGFDRVCGHHACKDRLPVEQVGEMLLHLLGQGPFPLNITGFRIYQSGIDEDQLGAFHCRAGSEPAETVWYAAFWRRYWYESFTGMPSKVPAPAGPPPDADQAVSLIEVLAPAVDRARTQADDIVRVARARPLEGRTLQALQRALVRDRERLVTLGMSTMATIPATTEFLRAIQSDNVQGVGELARHQAWAYAQWSMRLEHVRRVVEMRNRGTVEPRPMFQRVPVAVPKA